MGLFGRLFGDPEKDLEKAEAWLRKGEPGRALDLALSAAASAGSRAAELAERAREALVEQALEKASLAEASEYFGDAAEWLQTAAEHLSGARREELEGRIESLLARQRDVDAGDPFDPGAGGGGDGHSHGEGLSLGVEEHFLALLGTLRDEVADAYEELPADFQAAYVSLNEGRAEEALAGLERLAAERPRDPVVLLERGRCRLVNGDPEGAASDLDAVWDHWGDEPLDLPGTWSVPSLWAEAALAGGRAGAVTERLAELAVSGGGRADLAHPYAVALLETERLEEAADFLSAAAPRNPRDPELPFLLAQVLARQGDKPSAAACLEAAIAPSCASGSCSKPPYHPPSLRALAALYLEDGRELGRVQDLLIHLTQAQGGRLAAQDHLLLARLHELEGHPDAAAEAREQARSIQEALAAGAASAS